MRIRLLLAALLATVFAAATLAVPAAAAPATGRAQLAKAVAALWALEDTNVQGTYRATGELPVHFARESRTRYSLTTAASSQTVIDGVAYLSLTQADRARAQAAGHLDATWLYMDDDDMFSWDMPMFTGDLDTLVTQGTLKRQGRAFVLSVTAGAQPANTDATVSDSTTATIELDSSGRVVLLATVNTHRDKDVVTTATSTLNLEYGTATITAPLEGTAFPIVAAASFPTLDPLEEAAYATAQTAVSIGIADRGYVSVDAIEEAALEQPTPVGLVASYTATGLRYEMDGRSLCIDVRADRQAAVVAACTA